MAQISLISKAPIGVFDSGMGGLTVLAELRRLLPNEHFLYLGDTARLPYGTKSATSVQKYAIQATEALVNRGVKAVVVACNTASGIALDALATQFSPVPIYGVVLPGAAAAAAVADHSGVLVLATESTVKGGAYQRALLAENSALHVFAHACPLWVTLAEMGAVEQALIDAVVGHDLRGGHPRTVLLGCTHFPVFRTHLQARYPATFFVDSAATTAAWVSKDLAQRDLCCDQAAPEVQFLATDSAERFQRIGAYFLGDQLPEVELVDL